MIGKLISHYRILEELGRGGMGVVYKAEDTKLKRLVALKFLPLELTRDEEAKERFVHEAQAASALDHPNICNIHEIDETQDGQIFICMAYYEGETIKKKVTSGQLSVNSVIDIAMQVAQGLAKAHEHGIVHRDLKPTNVMITNDGVAKIVDFGLAKLAGQTRLTKSGMTVGTAAYMSPEQARGEEVDSRTDIWSLGVVIYEMLTGRLPFRGEYEAAITYSILNEEPDPITGLRTGVPMELERIVNKTMAKKPGERYQHIDEMLVDLKSLSKKIDLSSLRPSTPPLRLPRRKQLYLYGGLAALVVLLIVGVLYFFIPPWRDKSIDSLAILPFNIANPDPDTDYLCDGITESLINSLSPLPNLTVMSRNAVFRYKGQQIDAQAVGRELKVKAVLTGRTVLRGENLSISVELVEVRNNSHLWGEHYNRKFAVILEVQDEIANQISEKLRLRLTSADRQRLTKRYTENTEAYQLFLKGRYYVSKFTKEGLQKGLEYFNQAIAMDPLYALAYDGLASYYIAMNDWFLSPREAMPKAKAAAQKALEIDETLAEAHSSLGVIKVWYDWDWLGAQREFKRTIELNPNYATAHDWYALSLGLIGLHDDALAVKKRALELDPLSINVNATLGATFYDARRYDLAIEQLRKTVDMDPNFWFAHFYLGRAYVQKGEFAEALAEFQKARQLEDTIPEILGGYGYALAVSGRTDEAQKMIDELMQRSKQSYISPYNIAIIYVGLGAKDQAFEWLEKAYEERSYLLSWLKVNPELDGLRSDPRFTALMKKVGFEK